MQAQMRDNIFFRRERVAAQKCFLWHFSPLLLRALFSSRGEVKYEPMNRGDIATRQAKQEIKNGGERSDNSIEWKLYGLRRKRSELPKDKLFIYFPKQTVISLLSPFSVFKTVFQRKSCVCDH